jgi:molybdopterin synthase catalytic subunit/molybdopterin converting factor small subunit
MNIHVRLSASYREQAGTSHVDVTLADGGTVAELIVQLMADIPALPASFKPHLIAVNDEFANPQYPVNDGDEVALYPPVSGGVDVRVVHETVDAREMADAVRRDFNGAIVTFEGTTRNETGGESVLHLEYETDERMATKILTQILEETSSRFGVPSMAARHRVGRLEIGDVSLIVAAGAPHRLEAFLATQYAVDRIKHIVPVWKKEFFENGSVWVGAACEPEHHARELAEAPYAGFLALREGGAQREGEHESARTSAHEHLHA